MPLCLNKLKRSVIPLYRFIKEHISSLSIKQEAWETCPQLTDTDWNLTAKSTAQEAEPKNLAPGIASSLDSKLAQLESHSKAGRGFRSTGSSFMSTVQEMLNLTLQQGHVQIYCLVGSFATVQAKSSEPVKYIQVSKCEAQRALYVEVWYWGKCKCGSKTQYEILWHVVVSDQKVL